MIDFDDLAEFAKNYDCLVALKVRTGDFVHPGMTLAELSGCEADEKEILSTFHKHFILGATRTPKQDPDFLIDELVEIALRALSPGINDPFTAITAMHWLGAATAELGRRDLRKDAREEVGKRRIFPLPDGFAHYVARGFGKVRSGVATNAVAVLVAFDTIRNAICAINSEPRRALLEDEARRLISQTRLALAGPDLAEAEARYAAFIQPS